MITFEEAYEKMLAAAIPTGNETVPLAASLNRILAEDVHSDVDMPPFNKSAMDGYACRQADLANDLTMIEEIPAGVMPKKSIGPNQCAKIMTGAVVPEGADCVIMVEFTEETGTDTIRYTKDSTKGNICFKGEDIKVGDLILEKGARILPEHIAVLAAVGCSTPLVAVKPKVGIIATGSELVDPDQPVSGAMIRNSNSWQLAAQAEAMGCDVINYGIVEDTVEALDAAVKKALVEDDLLILSGGVSMGDFDLVPGILKANGIDLVFDRVAIKPGKPSTFGVGNGTRCMGLPGNPVSTFVQFEIMVKPFLFQMMGHDYRATIVKAELLKDVRQKQIKRMAVIPVKQTEPGKVMPIDYHGSAHISAMCTADGIITIPYGEREITAGTVVDVRLLR